MRKFFPQIIVLLMIFLIFGFFVFNAQVNMS